MPKTTYDGIMPSIDDFCDPEPREMFPGFPDFLFTKDELDSVRVRDKLECKCSHCGKVFERCKRDILKKHYRKNKPLIYCSQKCCNEHRTVLANDRNHHDYICQTCGREVKKGDWYGSGMFCCERCAKSYAGKLANTSELRQKKSEKLKKKRFWNGTDISYFQCRPKYRPNSHQKHNPSKKQYSQSELVSAITFLHKKWNLRDINNILCIPCKSYKDFIQSNNISENDQYVDFKRYKVIERCRIALNKPFEDGSITVDDLKTVQDKCHKLMFEDDWSAEEVCRNYLQMEKPNPKFLELSLGIELRSLSMASIASYRKNGYYDNRDAEEAYRAQCEFRLSSNLYPYIFGFELVKLHGWYHPIKNPYGISKDHMVSVYYGFTHNIDPYLISHPANCMFMLQSENASKCENCSITVQELIERVEWFNETILYRESNLDLLRQIKIRYKPSRNRFSIPEMNHFAALSLV